MAYININGKIIAENKTHLPVDNGAFRYGYGLFETMLVRNGCISNWAYHYKRLFSGMKLLQLEIPYMMKPEWLSGHILATVNKNKLEALCRVRLQVFAGGGGLFGQEIGQAGFIIECFPLQANETGLNENGLILGFAEGLYKSIDTLSNLKSCNALIYSIAARQAKHNKWNDAILFNCNKNAIETTIANLFWIKDGMIFTPPLSEGCIAGVRRQILLELLTGITTKALTKEELLQADEVFVTNAIKGIRWVRAIEGKTYTNSLIKSIVLHQIRSNESDL